MQIYHFYGIDASKKTFYIENLSLFLVDLDGRMKRRGVFTKILHISVKQAFKCSF